MWTLAGAPIDSSGRNRGEGRAPAALRNAGIAEIPGVLDEGDLATRIDDPTRDPETGVVGFADLLRATGVIAEWAAEAAAGPGRALLLGGDCSLLPGVFVGLRRSGIEAGLWLLDGHPDTLDGESSPTGEAADMDVAFLLGRGPQAIRELAGAKPLLEPGSVALLGHRPRTLGPDAERELALLPDAVLTIDAPTIAEIGGAAAAQRALDRLAGRPVWLHLDLDVLDPEEFPAVTYTQPLGLDWSTIAALLEPLASAESLIGISVADLEPDRDPGGAHARRLVELLRPLLD